MSESLTTRRIDGRARGGCWATLRLTTWNVAGRKRLLPDQVAYLQAQHPDVICLQEVTPGTVNALDSALREAGYAHVIHSITPDHDTTGPRRYGLLVAASRPIQHLPTTGAVWPERMLAVETSVSGQPVAILTTHIPPGAGNGWIKIDMLEAVAAQALRFDQPVVVCGDFNCPKLELADGTIITWAQRSRKDGSFYIGRGYDRWDAGERGVISGLPSGGLLDIPRALHGFGTPLHSYYDIRNGKTTASRRYDHVFASVRLQPLHAEYDDAPRAAGLSDHKPLSVELRLVPPSLDEG